MYTLVRGDISVLVLEYGTRALSYAAVAFPAFLLILRGNFFKSLGLSLMTGYLYLVTAITLLSRESGEYAGVVGLGFFDSLQNLDRYTATHYIENFILLLPLGFFLPLLFKLWRYPFLGLMSGFVGSFIIETIQYTTQLGMFDLEDIVLNGLGGACGYILWAISRFLFVPRESVQRKLNC